MVRDRSIRRRSSSSSRSRSRSRSRSSSRSYHRRRRRRITSRSRSRSRSRSSSRSISDSRERGRRTYDRRGPRRSPSPDNARSYRSERGGNQSRRQQLNGRAKREDEFKIFVGNLPFDVNDDEIRNLFTPCGHISSFHFPRRPSKDDDGQMQSKGFGFIGFQSADEAANACMLTGTEVMGRKIRVDIASKEGGRGREEQSNRSITSSFRPEGPASKATYKPSRPEPTYEWGKPADAPSNAPAQPIEAPNFEVSGNLGKAERTAAGGTELKFDEPEDARKPAVRWRLYLFKNGEPMLQEDGGFYKIHRQSAYLFGRDRGLADIPTDHPSCSKQHAVLQYRKVGNKPTRPYIMDLDSVNGTFINGERIEGRRYYELLEKDLIKFGTSSRDYIILHDDSGDIDEEED